MKMRADSSLISSFFLVQGDTGAIKTMQFLLFFVVAQIKDI